LKPGVTREAANAELQPLIEQWAKGSPDDFPQKFRVHLKGFNDDFLKRVGPSLYLLGGAVVLLLLIGCANVSILLLARGTSRQHEIALRSAIGASRWHIQRQLLTEALVLSLAGCAAGVLLAYRLLPLLIRWLPDRSVPHEADIRINVPVLLFSVALAAIMGALAGLAPAFQFSTPKLAQLMHSGSRRTTGSSRGKATHQLLVAGQIALTLLLLTSSAAAVNGFVKLVRTDLGYDPHNTMSVGIPIHEHTHESFEDRSAYFGRLLARVQAMPEVVVAGISSNATPPSNGSNRRIEVFGASTGAQEQVRVNYISSEYFNVLHIPLEQGRLWDASEIARGARLAVIGRAAAKRYWPSGDAIGKKLRLPEQKPSPPFVYAPKDADSWIEIIGVVADARDEGLRKPIAPQIYVPYSLTMWMSTQILVRTRSSPLAILNRVRAEIKAVDPDQQVFGQVRDLDQWIESEDEYQYGRLVAALFSGLSLMALALAALGLFSVVSYGVAQRTNEFGIRMALGATGGQLLALAFRATAASVLGGVAAGIALTFAFSKLLARWAEGSEQHPWTFLGAVLVLLLTAAVAAFVPARRASAVDPMEALRYD
jgi:predicted permease